MFSDTPLSKSFTFKCQTSLKILQVRPKFADFYSIFTAFSLHYFAHVGLCFLLQLQIGGFFELLSTYFCFLQMGENTHINISTLTVIFRNYSCFCFSHSIQYFSDFYFYLFLKKLLFIYFIYLFLQVFFYTCCLWILPDPAIL